MSKIKPNLIFTDWSVDTGVFFEEGTFYKIWNVDDAIEKATTWGEFRELLSTEVFESLPFWYEDFGGRIYWDGENYLCIDPSKLDKFLQEMEGGDEDCYVIKHSDELNISEMADYDHPMWVVGQAWNDFPQEFLDRFASQTGHSTSGSWIEYPKDEYEEMEDYLSDNGFTVDRIEYNV